MGGCFKIKTFSMGFWVRNFVSVLQVVEVMLLQDSSGRLNDLRHWNLVAI